MAAKRRRKNKPFGDLLLMDLGVSSKLPKQEKKVCNQGAGRSRNRHQHDDHAGQEARHDNKRDEDRRDQVGEQARRVRRDRHLTSHAELWARYCAPRNKNESPTSKRRSGIFGQSAAVGRAQSTAAFM